MRAACVMMNERGRIGFAERKAGTGFGLEKIFERGVAALTSELKAGCEMEMEYGNHFSPFAVC